MEDAIDLIVRHNNEYDPGASEPNEYTQDSVTQPAERAGAYLKRREERDRDRHRAENRDRERERERRE
jgi:hypothetical protein